MSTSPSTITALIVEGAVGRGRLVHMSAPGSVSPLLLSGDEPCSRAYPRAETFDAGAGAGGMGAPRHRVPGRHRRTRPEPLEGAGAGRCGR